MLFDHCAECRRCCNIDAGSETLEVTLTAQEARRYNSICIESVCPHLGPHGCTLGAKKPFGCKLYPLSYNPRSRDFFFDTECPLQATYFEQLNTENSEATQHLSSVKQEILQLEASDPEFLAANFEVDEHYFQLVKIPRSRMPVRTE